ncbi:MAG: DUF5666 domain-containing protein [Burkholderiaceae bacterium]
MLLLKFFHTLTRTTVLLWMVLALAACGVAQDSGEGGVGEDGSGVAPPATVVGVLKGVSDRTVTVNGVVFDQTRAALVDGFGNPLTRAQLKLGMWVQVDGSVDDAGKKGEATRIQVRLAVRGNVAARETGGMSVTVLGSTAKIGADVVFDGVSVPNEIEVGDVVEVHGALGSGLGQINASRVELIEKNTNARFELRGKVSMLDLSARTMVVGKQAVRYDAAQISLANNALFNRQIVRVFSSTPPADGQHWAVQRVGTDQELPPQRLAFYYVEGVISDWEAGPKFAIEGVRVDASNAQGRDQVTSDGLTVAAFGAVEKGIVIAKAVTVVTPGQPAVFTLSGPINRVEKVTSFQMRGVWVNGALAQYINGDVSQLAKDRVVKVEGVMIGRSLQASKIEFTP